MQSAQAGSLNVVSDYDGTQSVFVPEPSQAWPVQGAVRAAQNLAAAPNTTFTNLTGRSRAEIERFYRDARNELAAPFDDSGLGFTTRRGERGVIYVIGQHGADVDPLLGESYAEPLTPDQEAFGVKIQAEIFEKLAATFGYPVKFSLDEDDVNVIRIECKPTGASVHTRSFDAAHRADAVAIRSFARDFYADNPPVQGLLYFVPGSEVLEITTKSPDKGRGIELIRERFEGPIVFLGDDFTDLYGFAALRRDDFGIVIGDKIRSTLAEEGLLASGNLLFVANPDAAVALLTDLATLRLAQ